jgi:hypothetical protein
MTEKELAGSVLELIINNTRNPDRACFVIARVAKVLLRIDELGREGAPFDEVCREISELVTVVDGTEMLQ